LAESEPDRLAIVRALKARGVEFVIIGGVAAFLHGVPLPSLDLDVVAARTAENLSALSKSLVDMGSEVLGAGRVRHLVDGDWLTAASFWNFTTTHGRLDVLFAPAGAGTFAEIAAASQTLDIGEGDMARIASVPDLIAMKEAANRAKDQNALAFLRWLRDRTGDPPF
jgi:hypothetical protein